MTLSYDNIMLLSASIITMATISVPLKADEEKDLQFLLDADYGSNKADVIRRALRKAAEDEAVERVLRAERELTAGKGVKGDLRKLAA